MLPCWRVQDMQLLLYSFALIPTNTNTHNLNNTHTQNSRPHVCVCVRAPVCARVCDARVL